jgi:hypothetical protein
MPHPFFLLGACFEKNEFFYPIVATHCFDQPIDSPFATTAFSATASAPN